LERKDRTSEGDEEEEGKKPRKGRERLLGEAGSFLFTSNFNLKAWSGLVPRRASGKQRKSARAQITEILQRNMQLPSSFFSFSDPSNEPKLPARARLLLLHPHLRKPFFV